MLNHLKGRKLYRRPSEALVFGICAGLAHYLRVDTVFVRLLVLALAVITDGWPTLVLYVVAVFIVPIDPAQDTVPSHQEPKDVTSASPPKEQPVEKMESSQNM